MTLTEFLLARIAEDEAWVVTAECGCGDGWPQRPHCPDRVALECEAKRRIVESEPDEWENGEYRQWHYTLSILAAVFADHPDYREEWRP
jgi:hypothetical protein